MVSRVPADFRILQGEAFSVLHLMPSESVDCCVTSPPYWGARDYGTGQWIGGDPMCKHKPQRGLQGTTGERANRRHTAPMLYHGVCGQCGAVREDEQIGLEETPDEFVARLVAVFREVRRILKPRGVLWVNMGDTYCSRPNGTVGRSTLDGSTAPHREYRRAHGMRKDLSVVGLKHKDLVGAPWMLAFSLRADGWYLRQDVIWHKPNPQPESVKDRCTKAHEYVFLLTKSERYYWSGEAMQEPVSGTAHVRGKGVNPKASRNPGQHQPRQNSSFSAAVRGLVSSRNKRSVWSIVTEPYRGSHFAAFPTALAEICIRAASPLGGIVLDPFSGTGRTGITCLRTGRRFVGIELNADFSRMAYEGLSAEAWKVRSA